MGGSNVADAMRLILPIAAMFTAAAVPAGAQRIVEVPSSEVETIGSATPKSMRSVMSPSEAVRTAPSAEIGPRSADLPRDRQASFGLHAQIKRCPS